MRITFYKNSFLANVVNFLGYFLLIPGGSLLIAGISDFSIGSILAGIAIFAAGIGCMILAARISAQKAARKQMAVQKTTNVVVQQKPDVVAEKRRSVKMIFQRKPAECGAACLAMIMDYLGMPITLDQACAASNVTDEGCKASDVMRAGKAYGLDVRGYRNEAENLRDYTIPVMIHWCGNHFVVLDEIQGDTVYINDPAVGRVKMDFAMLQEKYSNVVLIFNRT